MKERVKREERAAAPGDRDLAHPVDGDRVGRRARVEQRAVADEGNAGTGRRAGVELDAHLRSDGNKLNPGTTADLVAACLFVALADVLFPFKAPDVPVLIGGV